MIRVAYVCAPNGWSLHNVGRSLVAPMAARGVAVEVVDRHAWHARPTPADVAFLAHTDFYRPGFPYKQYVRDLAVVVHDPDEVSTFYDRLSWARAPLHHAPHLAAYDRVATGSAEMAGVLRERYGLAVWHAATFPHNADAIRAARATAGAQTAGAQTAGAQTAGARPGGTPTRFISTAYGPERAPWAAVLRRLGDPRFWTRDEHGRLSPRQARSAFIRMHRKNTPWLERLGRVLGADPRAAPDFRFGRRHVQLSEVDYLDRLIGGDVYVCTSFMEGGPLPVMEAVLAGLAVVTTPVGQTAEWVRDGENGFFCRTYADVERATRFYLDRPDVLRAHQARSREIAAEKRFDADGWIAFLRGDAPARA